MSLLTSSSFQMVEGEYFMMCSLDEMSNSVCENRGSRWNCVHLISDQNIPSQDKFNKPEDSDCEKTRFLISEPQQCHTLPLLSHDVL